MVIRHYITCNTCKCPHTLRISIGHDAKQIHTMQCTHCSEEMTIELDIDFKSPGVEISRYIDCAPGEREGTVINLHPSFPIPEDQLHADRVFPWLENTKDLAERQITLLRERDLIEISENVTNLLRPGKDKLAPNFKTLSENWNSLKKAWNLDNNGKYELSKIALGELEFPGHIIDGSLQRAKLFFFRSFCSPSRTDTTDNCLHLIADNIPKFEDEFKQFLIHYRKELQKENDERYFSIFSEYFKTQQEYQQTLLSVQYGLALTEKSAVSSSNFRSVNMFYGNCFEGLAANFTTLALINNILAGRPYNQFAAMDLKKYLTSNKAGRSNPFKDKPELIAFADEFDSTLRNASHHGAMKIQGSNIMYRSGGHGAEHRISYTDYLIKCNLIAMQLASLLQVEQYLIKMVDAMLEAQED